MAEETTMGPLANPRQRVLVESCVTAGVVVGARIARRARVGSFGVNLYVPDVGAPWGGRKASGVGSVYGTRGAAHVPGHEVRVPARWLARWAGWAGWPGWPTR